MFNGKRNKPTRKQKDAFKLKYTADRADLSIKALQLRLGFAVLFLFVSLLVNVIQHVGAWLWVW